MPSAPPPSATTATSSTTFGNRPRTNTRVDAPPISMPGTGPKLQSTVEEETLDEGALSADFARELAKGMENLMQEITNGFATGDKTGSSSSNPTAGDGTEMTDTERAKADAERAKAFKAAWEAMLVEGLNGGDDAGRLEKLGEPLGKDGVKAKGDSNGAGTSTGNDFQSKIKQAMDKLKESESNLQSGSSSADAGASPESLEGLLKSLSDLGLGDGGEDDADLTGFLENMMGQLMSKEVLYEPLKELSDNFPRYLADPPAPLSSEDRPRYEKQYSLVKQIVENFERPGYSDANVEDSKNIMSLMTEMQSYGSPPAEIMGPLPPGFENGIPQNMDENCVIA
ncbi:Peroxisome biogenesis protein 19-1 [Leucoagaricus sp. SymC.cos]|nr:Peroxisome biogenesis protein 19-1 [Leucoagaricus sp. SymC.cos]